MSARLATGEAMEPETAKREVEGRARRAWGYAKAHPGTMLVVAAGVGAVAGVEWAVPALLGGALAWAVAGRRRSDEAPRGAAPTPT